MRRAPNNQGTVLEGVPVVVDKQRSLADALAALAHEPGLKGGLIATRDGLCVVNGLRGLVRPETLSAMAAATTGAAEAAMDEVGSSGSPLIVMEGSRHRLLSLPTTDDLLLIAVSEPTIPLDTVLETLRRVGKQIEKIVLE
jgi:predicted regulator of Ras-like GTPase activity (Roadblock/LC7/MglB family)